jgi:hypothetical protein
MFFLDHFKRGMAVLFCANQKGIMDDNWKLYGELDLNKSCMGDEAQQDHWLIKGLILTPNKDQQGEIPVVEKMDWSYFDRQGFIKFEHDPGGIPSPTNIIGVPHIRKAVDQGVYLEGRLLPRDEEDVLKGLTKDYARETAALIKALNKHNSEHPNQKRTPGFSIEGKYLSKSSDGHYIGKVINVAITANPQDINTYVEMAKSHNADMIKSMSTGSTYGVTDQTGGAAMRKESIKEDLVSETFNKPKKRKSRGKTMAEKKKVEVEDFLEDEMNEEAEDEDEDEDEKKEGGKKEKAAEKSLKESANLLKSAANSFKAIIDSFKKSAQPVPEEEMEKAVEPGTGDNEIVDITPFMEHVATTTEGLQKSFTEFVDNGEKRDVELAKALVHLADSNEALGNALEGLKTENEALKKSVDDVTKLVKAIGKSAPDISFLQLDQEKVVDDGNGKAKLNKGQTSEVLFNLARDKKIPFLEVTKFEQTGKLPANIAAFPEFN